MHDPCSIASGDRSSRPVFPIAAGPEKASVPEDEGALFGPRILATRMAFFLPLRAPMVRLAIATLVLVGALLGLHERAFACATLRATARIDQFSCTCTEGNLETPITVVSGTALIGNGRANPTLTSLVVELQARQGNSVYQPVARQVLSDDGSEYPPARHAQTCNGPLSAGPIAGRIKVVDPSEQDLTFDQIKNIPIGTTGINFVATFAGPLPQLKPGTNARVKVYTTAIGSDHPHPCAIDADEDGAMDAEVKTLIFQKAVRVPTTSFLINP